MGDRVEDAYGEIYQNFMKAVDLNDISKVDAMLQSMQQEDIILDINAVNEENKTPLNVAISSKKNGKLN